MLDNNNNKTVLVVAINCGIVRVIIFIKILIVFFPKAI